MENFKEKPSVPQIGSCWKHFKGNVYTVNEISRDCSDPNRFFVVYSDSKNSWVRELSDFLGTHETGVKRFTPVQKEPWRDPVTLMEGPVRLDKRIMDKIFEVLANKKEEWLPFGQAFPEYVAETSDILNSFKLRLASTEALHQMKRLMENFLKEKGQSGHIKITYHEGDVYVWYQPSQTAAM